MNWVWTPWNYGQRSSKKINTTRLHLCGYSPKTSVKQTLVRSDCRGVSDDHEKSDEDDQMMSRHEFQLSETKGIQQKKIDNEYYKENIEDIYRENN